MVMRVLIAKPGLDGHDRGAKLISRALRDNGFEVIFTGIRQRPQDIATAAVQEDVDVVGLSILSGAHLALTTKVVDALRAAGGHDIAVVVGGTVPESDRAKVIAAGAVDVYPTGTDIADIVAGIRRLAR